MKVNIKDLRYWPILNYLPASFLKNVRLVYVYGNAGSDVLLATKDDELFAFGFNSHRCHGIEGNNEVSYNIDKLAQIEELSNKRIKGFACCLSDFTDDDDEVFVLSYLESGEVYLWGYNPAKDDIFTTPSIIEKLPKTVIEVACGKRHILALTSDGQVFAWGDNSCRQIVELSQDEIPEPVIIKHLSSKNVTEISCGYFFSVVATSHGELYSWGENGEGQLGLNGEANCKGIPQKIVFLQDTCIKKIACGGNHVLALNVFGDVFSWGFNAYNQLGHENVNRLNTPSRIKETRFTEIAACFNLSIGITSVGKVEVWGETAGEKNSFPQLTPCRSINEAFALFNCGRMHKPVEIESEREDVLETMKKSFGNQVDSDFKFVVAEKEIHVHKTILKLRSEYFKRMFQEHWSEGNKSSAEIKDQSYEATFAFLKYLYTDELEVDPRIILEVAVLADKYCELNVINLCLRKFKEGLNRVNVVELYELTHEKMMWNFNELCIDFASCNLKYVINSDGFNKWKVDTYRSFFKHDKIAKVLYK